MSNGYLIVKYRANKNDGNNFIYCNIIKQKFLTEQDCIDFIKIKNPKIVFLDEDNNTKYTNSKNIDKNIELADQYSENNSYFYDGKSFPLECYDINWCFGIIPIKPDSRMFYVLMKTINNVDNFITYHFDNDSEHEPEYESNNYNENEPEFESDSDSDSDIENEKNYFKFEAEIEDNPIFKIDLDGNLINTINHFCSIYHYPHNNN